MAERIFKKLLADKLGCQIEQLSERGAQVNSAGMAAFPGGKPSREAVEILSRKGIDLSTHCSQPLTERLVRHADLILAMTNGHLQTMLNQWPDATPRAHLIRTDRYDIGDPIGQPIAAYQRCAEEISSALQPWVDIVAQELAKPILVE